MPTGVEIFYVKDITDKKVACQNQEVEGHIAGYLLQRTRSRRPYSWLPASKDKK
jgi:hypothetical protein